MTTALSLEEVKERQQKTWSSGDYGKIAWITVPLADVLCEAADLRSSSAVLDVATGTGHAALAAARRLCTVTGIDYVPDLLQQARARASTEYLAVEFAEGAVAAGRSGWPTGHRTGSSGRCSSWSDAMSHRHLVSARPLGGGPKRGSATCSQPAPRIWPAPPPACGSASRHRSFSPTFFWRTTGPRAKHPNRSPAKESARSATTSSPSPPPRTSRRTARWSTTGSI